MAKTTRKRKPTLKKKLITGAEKLEQQVKIIPEQDFKINLDNYDYSKLSALKVEFFDDRFYKVGVPKDIEPAILTAIPPNFIDFYGEELSVYLPSYSTIMSEVETSVWLRKWRERVGEEEAERISGIAKLKGSNIHNAIDKLAQGYAVIYRNPKFENDITLKEIKAFQRKNKCKILLIEEQEEMLQIKNFQSLVEIIKPVILHSEQPVFNFAEGYAGTLDQVWQIPEEKDVTINSKNSPTHLEAGLYVVDIKTGRGINERKFYCQLGAYMKAHWRKREFVGGIVVRLNSSVKSGLSGVKIFKKTAEELEEYYQHFLDIKKVYYFKNDITFPHRFEFPRIVFDTDIKISKEMKEPKKKSRKKKSPETKTAISKGKPKKAPARKKAPAKTIIKKSVPKKSKKN